MRFSRPAALALAATSVSANSMTLKPRSFTDVCANINVHLILGIPLHDYGVINVCLCVGALPLFITTDAVAAAAVSVLGPTVVTAALAVLINAATSHQTCNYPDHAIQQCTPSNVCNFDCKDGFAPFVHPMANSCTCEPPKLVCDDMCRDHYEDCSSPSQMAKRNAPWRDAAACPPGWSACGVWGGNGPDYECVDVRNDLWSCGGCDMPLLSTDPTGVDCTAIAGVHDVACVSGHCIVERCKDGLEVSADRSACVPNTRTKPHNPSFVHNGGY